jgi:O-antigen/teichoic acid export membrane protein
MVIRGMKGARHRIVSSLGRSRAGIRDFALSLAAQATTAAIGLAGSILTARGLSPAELGSYALIVSVVGFIGGLADLGIGQTAIRFGARAHAASDGDTQFWILRWAIRSRTLLAIGLAAAALVLLPTLAARAWHGGDLLSPLRLALVLPVLQQLAANVPVFLQMVGDFTRNAFVAAQQGGLALLGIAVLFSLHLLTVPNLVLINIATTLLSALSVQWAVPRGARWWAHLRPFARPMSAPQGAAEIRSFARSMVLTSATAQLIMSADVWFLAAHASRADVGAYSVAVRFTLPLSLALGALNAALWPRVGRIDADHGTSQLMRRLFPLTAVAALPVVAYSLLAPLAAPWLFGRAYVESVRLGQILCLRYAVGFCGLIFVSGGYNLGYVRGYPLLNLFRLATFYAISRLLFPTLRAAAVPIGLLCMETASAFTIAFLVRRRLARPGVM